VCESECESESEQESEWESEWESAWGSERDSQCENGYESECVSECMSECEYVRVRALERARVRVIFTRSESFDPFTLLRSAYEDASLLGIVNPHTL